MWRQPTETNELRNDEVHVWRVNLDQDSPCVQRMSKYLSEDEQKKADRFFFDKDRKRYIVVRGVLRVVLSGHLGKDPSELRFLYNRYGKQRQEYATLREIPRGEERERAFYNC